MCVDVRHELSLQVWDALLSSLLLWAQCVVNVSAVMLLSGFPPAPLSMPAFWSVLHKLWRGTDGGFSGWWFVRHISAFASPLDFLNCFYGCFAHSVEDMMQRVFWHIRLVGALFVIILTKLKHAFWLLNTHLPLSPLNTRSIFHFMKLECCLFCSETELCWFVFCREKSWP